MLSNDTIERLSEQAMHAVRYEDLDDRHGAFTREFARLVETVVREQIEDTPAPSVADEQQPTAGYYYAQGWDAARARFEQAPSVADAAGASDKPLTDAQIEAGWRQTFSTDNPYCPCNLKSFTKAVRWAERAKEQK